MSDEEQLVIMQLIMDGGNAKSSSFEAIQAAKKGAFDQAQAKLKEADSFLAKAHNAQTDLLTTEAQGQHAQVSLLMVHGQDHVMNAITFRDLAGELVSVYQRLSNNSEK
ncbi:MAG: PTS lactose/cellobiose transporter subunit IIA [Liquorilactobacillus ghanensis]|uniref:PTS lactose/cellobiose transporter subunit IIA n=1 Tax=Liquorilactobacillus ghanensis TaxID=399370 RepID=UPI0039E9D002